MNLNQQPRPIIVSSMSTGVYALATTVDDNLRGRPGLECDHDLAPTSSHYFWTIPAPAVASDAGLFICVEAVHEAGRSDTPIVTIEIRDEKGHGDAIADELSISATGVSHIALNGILLAALSAL